jgi:hypothetical protein
VAGAEQLQVSETPGQETEAAIDLPLSIEGAGKNKTRSVPLIGN